MSEQISNHKPEDIYSKIYTHLKHFPKILYKGSNNPPTVSGPAAAALLSATFGCFMMMVTHHLADTSKQREQIVTAIGSWMPGSYSNNQFYGDIGSYAGKQTMLIIGWLVSWLILHLFLKNHDVKPRIIFFGFFLLMIAATAMIWHPLFPYLPLT